MPSRSPGRSSAAPPNAAARIRAMAAVDQMLVKRPEGVILLLTPPFDQTHARSRLHQRVPARYSRKWRTVHPRFHLDHDRLCRPGRRRQSYRDVPFFESDQSHQFARSRAALQNRAVRSWPATCTRKIRIWAEEDGPGIPGRRGGSIAGGSNGFWACACVACCSRSIPAFRGIGRATRWSSATTRRRTKSKSKTLLAFRRESRLTELDGKILAGAANMPLEDDGKIHQLRVVLG